MQAECLRDRRFGRCLLVAFAVTAAMPAVGARVADPEVTPAKYEQMVQQGIDFLKSQQLPGWQP